MKRSGSIPDSNQPLHRALAEFRHQLRTFLLASEEAAHETGIHPQQHQLLLAVAGASPEASPSIGWAAELLGLKHNSVVELVDRCEKEGLLQRTADPLDRRRVCLKVSSRGQEILDHLSQVHLRELDSQAPHLIRTLQNVLQNETRRHKSLQSKKSG